MKRLVLMMAVMAMGLVSAGAQQSIGVRSENLNKDVRPQQDFYDYACGGWMKLHPLTGEYSRLGSFDMLAEETNKQVKELVVELASTEHARGSVGQKIGDLYRLSMDSVRRNAEGTQAVQPFLQSIAEAKNRGELMQIYQRLYIDGLASLFELYVDADAKNASMNAVSTYQSGLGLGNKDYYTGTDKVTKKLRKQYQAHVQRMFGLYGYDKKTAKNAATTVLRLETRLAEASFTKVELRNPEENYNKMSWEEVTSTYPHLQWAEMFGTYRLKKQPVIVGQKRHLAELNRMIGEEDLDDLKVLLLWQVIDHTASYLSDEVYAANFDFFGKVMSGKQEPSPRWKRSIGLLNSTMGEALGQMYVEKYFPAEAKERMVQLVKNLQTALGQRIEKLEWMSDETKGRALEKLNSFYVKIGYPDEWRDYSALDIRPEEPLVWNLMMANRFEMEYNYQFAGKPVDKDRWQMTPQTVNAYYNPTTNEICFPAGILQYPFFDMTADDAFNYGAIGVVIGHEMTHGFDDKGSLFDKDGNLNNWWTDADRKQFEERTKVLEDYFNAIEVLPGLHANGKFTLGENLADHGGLQISYQAYQNARGGQPLPTVDGLTPEQRFFLAYAGVWANNIREAEIRKRVKGDPHSLGRWRVNGALPHIQAWYDAFGVTKESPMYVAPEKRCTIW